MVLLPFCGVMSERDDACAAIYAAADEYRAAAISASHAVAESPYPADPARTANLFHEELHGVADELAALAEAVADTDSAASIAEPLADALVALSTGLPNTFDSDHDTSHAVYRASAAAFLHLAEALGSFPVDFNDLPEDSRPLITYQAAKVRADVRLIAHAFDDLLATRVTFDREVLDAPNGVFDDLDDEAFDAAYEIHSTAEAAALFVVCDLAEALAGAHYQRTNTKEDEIQTVEALHPAASSDEQQSRMAARLTDFHPWIATRAEPLFADGHYQAAIVAALLTLETEWRSLLGVDGLSLGELAKMSFDRRDPTQNEPRLRIHGFGPEGSVAWRNAHDGAQQYAIGCAKRIRSLAIHHPQDLEPDATSTLETLGALSTLARWVTEASVVRAS